MERPLIMMTSITYAMKGKQLLQSHGIHCKIERTPGRYIKDSRNCGYSLYVPNDMERAVKLLKENGIKISGSTAGHFNDEIGGDEGQ